MIFVSALFCVLSLRAEPAQPTQAEDRLDATKRARKSPERRATRPDRYQVWVLTYGPGDHPFSKFGHNALWVSDRKKGTNRTYNFGTFEMRPGLIGDFLEGRLHYWLSVSELQPTLLFYEAQNRSAVAQLLSLTRAQETRLVRMLEKNALPENREYLYDYYLDNCSTRVRDVLDEVLDGKLREEALAPQSMTWREHTMRLAQDDFLLTFGLDLALGPLVDQSRPVWDEMFLPSVLQETLRKVEVGPHQLPLVVRETTLVSSDRPPEPKNPPLRYPSMLLYGCLAGILVLLLGAGKGEVSPRASKLRAVGFYLILGTWGLFSGALGWLLSYFWLATDHTIAYRNANILVFAPWAIALPVLCGLLPFWRSALTWITACCVAAFVSTLVALVLLLPSIAFQDNRQFVAGGLPLWGAFAAVCLIRRARYQRAGVSRSPVP